MRILIDECVDPRVKILFANHTVATVHERRWDEMKDRPLLMVAQREFDVLLTLDGNLEFQQNLSKYSIGVVVAHVPKNQLRYYQAIRADLIAAIQQVQVGKVIHVRA